MIERDQEVVIRAEEDFAIANRDTAILNHVGDAARDARTRRRIPVVPDQTARGGLEREHLGARRDQIHDTINNDRRGVQVLGIVAGLKDPRGSKIFHVARVDLIQSAIPPRKQRATVGKPVGAGRAAILSIERHCRNQDQKPSLHVDLSSSKRPPFVSIGRH